MVSMMAKTDQPNEVPKVTTKKRAPPLVATSSSSRPTAANKKPRSLVAPLLIAGPPQQAAPPRSSRRWPESLEALKKFKREHGHANVPHGYDQDTALSSWVKKQRKCRESLTEAKRKALDAVGFIWEPNSKKWNDNSFRTIQELRQQLYDNGTLKLGMKLTCDAFSNHIGHKTKIANWFRHQVLTKDTELTPQQRLQLDTLLNELATGVPPNHQQQTPTTIIIKKSPNKKSPNKKSTNHKGNNNKKRKPNKSSLASNKKKKTATVVVPQQNQSPSATTTTTARRKPLQQPLQQNPQDMDHQDMALLVDDHHNNDHLWYTKLAQVIQLGHGLDISNLDPIDYSQRINDETTATWFRHQIRLLRRGRLNNGGSVLKARQSKLMAFLKQFRNGHDYAIVPPQQQQQQETTSKYSRNAAPSRWLDRFDALKQFKQAFGHTIVPHPYPADMTLGQWVRTQRRTRPSMLPARRQALDDIGFVWEPKNKKWNDRFDGCRNKKRVWYEHARRRPKGTIEEFADYLGSSTTLGRWFLSQLEQLRKGSLNEDQETRFELFLSNLSSYSPAEEAPQQPQQPQQLPPLQQTPMISALATSLGTEESGAFLPKEEGSDEEGDVFDDAEEEQDTMGESLQEQQQDKKQQQQQEEKKEETESWIVPAQYMSMTTTTGPANQYYNAYHNVPDTNATLGPAVPVQADNDNNPTQYMPITTTTGPANQYYNAYHNVPDTNATLGPEGPVPAQYIPMTTTSPANQYYNVPDTTTCTLEPAVTVQANNNPTKKEMGGDDYIFMLGLQREEDEEYETI
ncbi:Helicase associated domain [Seminavis robusta]|uniref:Helicase associated domain n=1 Tax=Seminavis robusta TaxID=568900 RepID=A0A9N8HHE0_9STRA|nr:Helicase associated domain [Seminavis robusta]|eukprot:Sro700_g189560.1 Helicase associated domain (797) ;mRNA; r:304-2694